MGRHQLEGGLKPYQACCEARSHEESDVTISVKSEKALLNHEEWELVSATHHPKLGGWPDADLQAARKRLRALHDKEQGFARQKRRVAKGSAQTRGGSFPGTAERPAERKQVFAQAMRRVNSEATRRREVAASEQARENKKQALARRRAAPSARPANTATARKGAAKVENTKVTTKVPGARIGSVTKQTARAQGKRDNYAETARCPPFLADLSQPGGG